MKTRHIILGLGLLGAALTAVVGGIGLGGLRWVGQAVQASTTANQATQSATMGDMMHEGLRGDVFQALYLAQAGRAADVAKARTEAKAHAQEFIERVAQLRALPLEPGQAEAAARLAPIVQRYADMGQALCERAATDLPGAVQALPAFEALFEELAQVQDALIESIAASQEATRDAALARQRQALGAMGAAALLGTVTLVLLASVGEVAALVEQMAGASQAQHQGIDRVVETVRQLEDMPQQNAALVEQSAAAAGSLHEQAGRLNAAVERFRVAG
jgi:methyl-accepting chemotaxis protein